jgi:hypothetical protein
MQVEVEAISPLLIYNLNPLESRLLSNTRITNPIPLKSNSKNISELIVLFFYTDYIYSIRPDYI